MPKGIPDVGCSEQRNSAQRKQLNGDTAQPWMSTAVGCRRGPPLARQPCSAPPERDVVDGSAPAENSLQPSPLAPEWSILTQILTVGWVQKALSRLGCSRSDWLMKMLMRTHLCGFHDTGKVAVLQGPGSAFVRTAGSRAGSSLNCGVHERPLCTNGHRLCLRIQALSASRSPSR